jgi:hypothetical protein
VGSGEDTGVPLAWISRMRVGCSRLKSREVMQAAGI